MAQVGGFDQTGVIRDGAARGSVAVGKPEGLIEFANSGERDPLTWKVAGECGQTVNVPCEESALGGSEVVLLSHEKGMATSPLLLVHIGPVADALQ